MTRLHWFWRGLIAVLAAVIVGLFLSLFILRLLSVPQFTSVPVQILLRLITPLVAVTVYGVLTARLGPTRPDPETRCRTCGYILRGLAEPRCPECGERI